MAPRTNPPTEPATEYIPRVTGADVVPERDSKTGGSMVEGGDAYEPRLEMWERALLALITGILVFGGAIGNVWVAFPACVVMVAVIFGLSAMHSRKRSNGVGRGSKAGKRAGVVLALAWAAIVVMVALVLFLVPAQFTLTGGILAAFAAAGLIWGAFVYADRPATG